MTEPIIRTDKVASDNNLVEDLIRVIRPLRSNHIFNEAKYDKVETTDVDGIKLIVLREKKNV